LEQLNFTNILSLGPLRRIHFHFAKYSLLLIQCSHQRFLTDERAGSTGLDSQIPPGPGNRPGRIPGTVGGEGQRQPSLGGLPHHLGRIQTITDPFENLVTSMATLLDEEVPDRDPDVLVQQLGGRIHHPEKISHLGVLYIESQ
jgi:hypothetical protein